MSPKLLLVGLVCLLGFVHADDEVCDFIHEAEFYGPKKQPPKTADGPLPKNFSWRNVDGKNYLTRIKNQKVPVYCGSCWAQSATSAISDRISIMRQGKFPEISLSTQVLLACDKTNSGCRGGSHAAVLSVIAKNPLPDESCSPYFGTDWIGGEKCTPEIKCQHCDLDGSCRVPESYHTYTVADEYGNFDVKDLTGIMNEIYHNGPVICGCNQRAINGFKGDGVYASNDPGPITHAVTIVGWGETDAGIPYWLMRNSVGEEYGDRGFIKIFRGNNTIQLESACTWFKVIPTWEDHKLPNTELGKPVTYFNGKPPAKSASTLQSLREDPRRIAQQSLPTDVFFGDIDGTNYLSIVTHQNIPYPCNSSWAHAVIGAMSDRINYLVTKNQPRVLLAVQPLINCQAGGSCAKGGDKLKALEYLATQGIAEVGCQPYMAMDPPNPECSAMQKCMTCSNIGDHINTCFDYKKPYGFPYRQWKIAEYGRLQGVEQIKAELAARGPVVCSMMLSPQFKVYKSGVYYEKTPQVPVLDHAVAIVGYGTDPATSEGYWIVRNTLGSQFGESGYFRILIGRDNLGIESDCVYGVPVLMQS